MAEARHEFYNDYGCHYFYQFVKANPEFYTEAFVDYCVAHNRGDRDSGELADIAKHEVLRLAHAFVESRFRFPNVHGDDPVLK